MHDYEGNDIYCDLILPGKLSVEVVKETDRVLAFKHTKPHWPVHIVVVPKTHIDSLLELLPEYMMTANALFRVMNEVAAEVKEEYGACRIVTNLGEYQDSKHLHFHIAYGEELGTTNG